jgi:DNA-binding MarR family transcriptional regulator
MFFNAVFLAYACEYFRGSFGFDARRLSQSSNHIEQSRFTTSGGNRRAKYYRLTRAGRKQVQRETREWEQTTAILARSLAEEKF